MFDVRQRDLGLTVSGLVPSFLLSLLASTAASFLLRRLLSTEAGAGGATQGAEEGRHPGGSVNVNVPVVVITIVARNRWAVGRRGGPPPFFLPFLLARLVRAKRQQRRGWQRRRK